MAKGFRKMMAVLLSAAMLSAAAPEVAMAASNDAMTVDVVSEEGEPADAAAGEETSEAVSEEAAGAGAEEATLVEAETTETASEEAAGAGAEEATLVEAETTETASEEAAEAEAKEAALEETGTAEEENGTEEETDAPMAGEETITLGETKHISTPEEDGEDFDNYLAYSCTFTPENDGCYLLVFDNMSEQIEMDYARIDEEDTDYVECSSIQWDNEKNGYTMSVYDLVAGLTYKIYLETDYFEGQGSFDLHIENYIPPVVTVKGNGGLTADGLSEYDYPFYKLEYSELYEVIEAKGTFSRPGYRLLGWSKDPESGGYESIDECYVHEGDVYYAIWEEIPILPSEGTIEINDSETYNMYPEESGWYSFKIVPPDSSYNHLNLTFKNVSDPSSEETTLDLYYYNTCAAFYMNGGSSYEVRLENNYNCSLDLTISLADTFYLNGNGGTTSDGDDRFETPLLEDHSLGHLLNYAPFFARDGYRHLGWAESADGTETIDTFSTNPEPGKTYYAIWGKEVTVTLHGNGGTLYGQDVDYFIVNTAIEGDPLSVYNSYNWQFTPPTGKQLAGWALTADAEAPDTESVTEDGLDLYAVWETAYYAVNLYAGNGYFAIPEETNFTTGAKYGEKLQILPSDIPTSNDPDKVFAGWYYDYACTQPLEVSLSEFSPTENGWLYAGYKDKEVKATGVKLNKKTASINVGKTLTLTATVSPKDATDKTLTWKSSNKKIAKVSKKGVVTGVRCGTCTITATTAGGLKASCKVTVKQIFIYELSKNGVYRYTTDTALVKKAKNNGWTCRKAARAAGKSSNQVYQIYDKKAKTYQYTADRSKAVAAKKAGKKISKIFFGSNSKSVPVYELYKSGKTSAYRYTTSGSSAKKLKKSGWKYKGIAYYSELTTLK